MQVLAVLHHQPPGARRRFASRNGFLYHFRRVRYQVFTAALDAILCWSSLRAIYAHCFDCSIWRSLTLQTSSWAECASILPALFCARRSFMFLQLSDRRRLRLRSQLLRWPQVTSAGNVLFVIVCVASTCERCFGISLLYAIAIVIVAMMF